MRLLQSAALIDAWFDFLPPGRQSAARALQAAILHAAPLLGQAVKWGNLVFTVSGQHAMALAPHQSHLHLLVFRGAPMVDRFPMLEGAGKGPRHLKWRYGQPFDEALVARLTRAVVDDMLGDSARADRAPGGAEPAAGRPAGER